MADRLVFTPPEVFRQMIDDLNAVASIPLESIRRLAELLEQQTAFLTDDTLAVLVSECIDDESVGSAAFNALQNLGPSALNQVLESVQRWRQVNAANAARFPDDLYTALQANLPALVREYPALSRMQKAKRLRVALGNELEGVLFICDARPVYNEVRDRIEGLIPLTTMKLVYERQNLETEEIEITITREQLKTLISEAQKAERKLTTLRQSIAAWIPDGCVDEKE